MIKNELFDFFLLLLGSLILQAFFVIAWHLHNTQLVTFAFVCAVSSRVNLPVAFPGLYLWYCCCLVTKSYLTLCNSMDCSPPGSCVHGIFQARILECIAFSFPSGPSLTQGLNLRLVSCFGRQILYLWATREALILMTTRERIFVCLLFLHFYVISFPY